MLVTPKVCTEPKLRSPFCEPSKSEIHFLYITFYNKDVICLMFNHINGSVRRDFGQPIKQTRGLFCKCESRVARHQSQLHCQFWQHEACFNCKWAYLAASDQPCCVLARHIVHLQWLSQTDREISLSISLYQLRK